MGELFLNALPLSVDAGSDVVVARVWERDAAFDEALRADPARGHEFDFRSFNRETFAWALPGGTLPQELGGRGVGAALGSIPAAVLASVVREAAVRRLRDMGLELRSNRLGQSATLSRRKRNLAADVVTAMPAGVGVYPAISVQGMPLVGDGSEPGEVALVIDQSVVYVLDVPLATLASVGIELMNLRMHWQHQPGCNCEHAGMVGDAGRFLGGDPTAAVRLRDGAGDSYSASAACLAVQASRFLMARYLASLNGRGERDIAEALKLPADRFGATPRRWKNLEATGKGLGELTLFDGVTATLGVPLLIPAEATLADQPGPVALPAVPEGNLNFSYGAPELNASAAIGLGRHGPYDEGQHRTDILRAVVVAPGEFVAEAKKLQNILTTGLAGFKGIKRRYHLRDFKISLHLFPDATRAGYENGVLAAAKAGDGVDIVFFVTRRDFRFARRGENPYLGAKAALASAGIASQAVTIETLNQPENMLQWSSDSVALAAYTKVGNIPYVLHDPTGGRELVLGIGRADIYDSTKGYRRQRFGASVAVRQDGDFLFAGSTTPVSTDEDYETQLARLVGENITRFAASQGSNPDRLVIYVFKRTGRHELHAVKNAIGNRNIEFALLHVNRDSPLWLVERGGSGIIAPPRGTTVALGDRDRLLVTGDPRKPAGAHPLRLTLDNKSTYRDMDRLVRQAYGFTKTSYRGFLQSNEPSPILFGRLLAQKVEQLVPYGFNPASAAGPLGDRPWFI